MGAVIARAERAGRGEMVEYGGRLVDPRYCFGTDTTVDLLGVTGEEMRACASSPRPRSGGNVTGSAGTPGVLPTAARSAPSTSTARSRSGRLGNSRASAERLGTDAVRQVPPVVWWLSLRAAPRSSPGRIPRPLRRDQGSCLEDPMAWLGYRSRRDRAFQLR